ncbi:hypothetical protein BST61_g8948 [Cercospora zeina]
MVFPKLQPLPYLSPRRICAAMQDQPELAQHATNCHKRKREDNNISPLVDASMLCATSQHEQASTSAAGPSSPSQIDVIDLDEAMRTEEYSISLHDIYLPMEPSKIIATSGIPSTITYTSSIVDDENLIDRPETIDWDNVRDDLTTPFEHDHDLILSQALPQPEPTERLIIPSDSRSGMAGDSDTSSMAQRAVLRSAQIGTAYTADLHESRKSAVTDCDPLEQTVNISDFLEATSITPLHEEVCKPNTGTVCSRSPAIEEVGEDDATFDGEQTFVCNEADTHWAVATTPFKIVTAEDVEEEDARMEGDNTLMIEEPECSPDTDHSPIRLVMAEEIPNEDQDAVEGEFTLSLEEPCSPGTITRSPIKLATLEDFPEDYESIGGDVTLALSSLLPQQPENAASIDKSGEDRDASRVHDEVDPLCYAELTASSRLMAMPPEKTAEQVPTNDNATEQSRDFSIEPNNDDLEDSSTNESSPYYPWQVGIESHFQAPEQGVAVDASSLKRKSLHHEADMAHTMAATSKRALSSRSRQMSSASAEAVESVAEEIRLHTPARSTLSKRPATAQKPIALRKIALQATTTPMQRTFKESTETPGGMAMTPHPSAPLRGVLALVDVYTHDGACVSQSFATLLRRLGAKTTKTFNDNVTHVVFKEGNQKLIQALTTYNMQVANEGTGKEIYCVNSRWVNDCDAQGRRVPEADEEYVVDVDEYPRSTKRRRKSMEPSSLSKTSGGDIIRDRRTSNGRLSIGRMGLRIMSDGAGILSMIDTGDKENSEDGSEPATPAYLKEPNSLIQQTVPANRVRKLKLGAKADTQRRLTFVNGVKL